MNISNIYRRLGVCLMLFWLAGGAAALDAPSGRPVLTVAGKVTQTNRNGQAVFDTALLDRLPVHQIITQTPWYDGAKTFEGPLLRDVLAAAGADEATVLVVKALNDYSANIPIEDARHYDVILARKLDGRPMAIRDKGPLFLIYPFDRHPELKSDKFYHRSVWQIHRIDAE